MKLLFNIIIAAIAGYTSISIASSPLPNELQSGWENIHLSKLKYDVAYIASSKRHGRLSMENGDNQAIQWIAKQFAYIGLKPANGNSYLQPVRLIQYTPNHENSYVLLNNGQNKTQWKKPDVFTEFNRNINVNGEVVFAGYGITVPDLKYDDYANVDVKGKIVLIFEHEPQERNAKSIFNGIANTIYATTRVKALNAQKHGAIAVLIAPEPNRKHPSNQERYSRIGGSVERKIPVPSQSLYNDELQIPVAVVSDNVANDVTKGRLSLSELQTKIDDNLKPQSQLLPNTTIVIHDENSSRKIGISYNVVGLLLGSDAKLKDETIIVSAHHDHDGMSGNEIWHGADDNASGTAGVIELARAMMKNIYSSNGIKPKRSVLFVVFAAEERGLLGAIYMTKHPLRPLNTTRAVINFDMIGRNETATPQTDGLINIPADTTNRLNLIGGHYSPDYLQIVKKANQYVGLTLDDRFDNESALNVFFRSDQFPFVLNNIPAFWWFTGFHPDYHHITDTADKINYEKMKNILRLAYVSVYQFANEATPPVFIKNPHYL